MAMSKGAEAVGWRHRVCRLTSGNRHQERLRRANHMTRRQPAGERRFHQIAIPSAQLSSGVYGPANTLVPWGRIALLAPRARTLAERVGLQFADSFDGLDYLQ